MTEAAVPNGATTPGPSLVDPLRVDARANPLAGNPFRAREDATRAVVDLYEPLLPHLSPGGARARLGSIGAAFPMASAELEGFARPLYGIVPMVAGGSDFAHWDRIAAGLDAGSDPDHPEYWGTITGDADQRMGEQAAIGLALAFCPEHTWDALSGPARDRLARWLRGVFDHQPVRNNWQFFRVLVALGLERVGVDHDRAAVRSSLDLLDEFRRGDHWYVDGDLGNVDYYVPMAFHAYGCFYAAANTAHGIGDDGRADAYRERASGFAADFQHWAGPDGGAVAMGRSLTYRFATSAFWGALAWADVEPDIGWAAVRGHALRNLRWWTDKPISDRDGVLSVGWAYANRRLCESYNSDGSPYWSMKAFGCLGAGADHPFWAGPEAEQQPTEAPVVSSDAGWVTSTDTEQTVALVGDTGLAFALPEQVQGKYRKFTYSSRFAFSGDCEDFLGRVTTDSTMDFTDDDGNRRVRFGVEAAGVETTAAGTAVAWSTWSPFTDVRVDSVCWFVGGTAQGRVHRIRNQRAVSVVESGFAVGTGADGIPAESQDFGARPVHAIVTTPDGTSAIRALEASGGRSGRVRRSAVNANLGHPHTVVPVLLERLEIGDRERACVVAAAVDASRPSVLAIGDDIAVPVDVRAVLARISS